jgi:hypothetical protein
VVLVADVVAGAGGLDELAAKAKAATPGPWFVDQPLDAGQVFVGNRADGRSHGLWAIVHVTGDNLGDLKPEFAAQHRADAEFIAAANPLVVAALIERTRTAESDANVRAGQLRASRAANERLRAERDAAHRALDEAEARAEYAQQRFLNYESRVMLAGALHYMHEGSITHRRICASCGTSWPCPTAEALAASRSSSADTEAVTEPETMRRDWTRPTAEMHNMANVPGATLRRACAAQGVSTSGTKRRLADRLLDAGITAVEVKERHGWRAAVESMQWCPDCPNGCAGNPAAVVAWIQREGGEARYEPAPIGHPCTIADRIVITGPDVPRYMQPGDEAVKGEWFTTNPSAPLVQRDRLREFTVRRPTPEDSS